MNCPCPCGSRQDFERCCGEFLQARATPDTAEQLMRSRYSAFCKKKVDYLIATVHPLKRQPGDRENLTRSFYNTRWLGLKIIECRAIDTGEGGEEGAQVEFAAFFCEATDKQRIDQLHERSNFIRQDGCWYYVDGELLAAYQPERNERCWCGSNKKFKKCHG